MKSTEASGGDAEPGQESHVKNRERGSQRPAAAISLRAASGETLL